MAGNDFFFREIDSIYVDEHERFVVSLIVGYTNPDHGPSQPQTPEEAAAAALALTTDEGRDGTVWFVFDRQTGQMHQLRQQDFQNLEVP